MKIACLRCGFEMNLNHLIFDNYEGEIKCFCCSSMMKIATQGGCLTSAILLRDGGFVSSPVNQYFDEPREG